MSKFRGTTRPYRCASPGTTGSPTHGYEPLPQTGEWLLSHSRKAASTRVCQPSPLSRNWSTTSLDNRIVMRSLVGVFWGPRTPSFLFSDSGNASAAGRNFARSSAVSSRTSPSASVKGLRLAMSVCLSRICFPEADYPNARPGFGETQNVQALVKVAQRNERGSPYALRVSGNTSAVLKSISAARSNESCRSLTFLSFLIGSKLISMD